MDMSESVVVKLRDAFTQVESDGSLDECLRQLSALAGHVLSAKVCTILLLSEDEVREAGLSFGAEFGSIPDPSRKVRKPALRQVISTESTRHRDEPGDKTMDNMISTIVLRGKIIGIIQVCQPQQQSCFSKDDLQLFSILTPLITKSIQVVQLQNILKSRFTQIALEKSGDATIRELISGVAPNPNQIARILAKSFYREMLSAGFNFNQIIYAATEVISELTASVRKHSNSRKHRQQDRGDGGPILLEAPGPADSAPGLREGEPTPH
ncbi:GAF domain-containing protein [Massilia cavernae]|uniref:GAF domain-containing protein n=1 Tax=Massilia cavernae TaxID=2320864 RepID=A0A418XAU4_9BURK|nr:GAF domain-containing protein [Massilia cavernae]RJG09590.1 GAF domain-containing protein [Massilia cavernae]